MEMDPHRRREIYEKAKSFEERVAELFRLQGFRTIVDYKRDDMQFDVRLEMNFGALPIHALVECKDVDRPVTQQQVREFASKVEYAAGVDKRQYQAILVARSTFANNAYAVAETLRVNLQTFPQLLLSLVDLGPNLDAAIQAFQGTPLERLYVEQDAVLEAEIRPGEPPTPKGLTETVLNWLDRPTSTFLALLGDFGCGKTSFSKRLAWELATQSKEKPGESRMPVLIDLREGGSTTVTLENLLTHHFQRLTSQAFNPQALLHLNREGYLLLIFDGFDETIAYTEPGRYLENLRQILRAAEGKAKVLLTCRTHYFRDRPEALKRLRRDSEMASSPGATRLYEEIQERAGAEVCYVLEFRERQIEEYLQRALPPPADWRAFRGQIRQTYNLEELAERPFLLEIIVKTLPRLLERGAEITLADLYETYCESWFAHTDFRLTLTRDYKVALVEYLACLIWDSPENRVHYLVLAEKAAEFFKDRPLTVNDKDRIDYEIRTALFLHRDAEGYYSFIHRSFLEFFIARKIRTGLAAQEHGCFGLRRLTREVAFFLEFWPESKQIPEVSEKVLTASYRARISENVLLLLYFHARAKLGPLVGPGAEGEPDLSQTRKLFTKLRPAVLRLEGADLEGALLPGIDLSGAHLEGASLIRADLRQASLDRARLTRAVLGFADLRGGSAEEADFSEADLNHLDAQDTSFRGTNLTDADLSFARFTRADFSQAKLKDVQTTGAGFLGAIETQGTPPAALTLRFQTGHSEWVRSVDWSPDGLCMATGSDDGAVRIWHASSGRLLNILYGHEHWVSMVAWAPDGQRLASASKDYTVRIWDAPSGRLLNCLYGHEGWVNSAAWAPDGQRLASASGDRTVRIWDASSGRLLNSLYGHEGWINSVAWAPDGQRLASASEDKAVRIWDASSGHPLHSLSGHEDEVDSVTWSPDGQRLASASSDNIIRLWDSSNWRFINSLSGHEDKILFMAWASDGQRLASASKDRTVRIWDAARGRLLNTLSGHTWAFSVAWAPDGQRLASTSGNTVRVWDASSWQLLNSLPALSHRVNSVAWAPDGQRLASASYDKTVRLWDASSGRLLNLLLGHISAVSSVAWAPDGQRLASASHDKTVRLWDASSGRLLKALSGYESLVNTVAWAPDGRRLASASRDNIVKLWEASSGRLLSSLLGHEDEVNFVSWAPDGQRLASASKDNTVRLWDASSGRLLNSLTKHENWVNSIAWAPDGQRLASASSDETLRIWDASSGRLLNSLYGHKGWIDSVAWAPDGQRLASGSEDHNLRIWDIYSGKQLHSLKLLGRPISLAWAPDGSRLAISFELGFIEIWNLAVDPPCPLGRLYHTPNESGFAASPDEYVSGPPEALEYVRFGEGWALYDITDVPERLSPERVAAALNPKPKKTQAPRARRRRPA